MNINTTTISDQTIDDNFNQNKGAIDKFKEMYPIKRDENLHPIFAGICNNFTTIYFQGGNN